MGRSYVRYFSLNNWFPSFLLSGFLPHPEKSLALSIYSGVLPGGISYCAFCNNGLSVCCYAPVAEGVWSFQGARFGL